MLETVKNYIRSIPDEPFYTYYHRYILEFQDELLSREASARVKGLLLPEHGQHVGVIILEVK